MGVLTVRRIAGGVFAACGATAETWSADCVPGNIVTGFT